MHLGLRYTLGHIGYQLISLDGLWSFYLVGLKIQKNLQTKEIQEFPSLHSEGFFA
jgi:hypothetical protein